jgi:hypothetical protein
VHGAPKCFVVLWVRATALWKMAHACLVGPDERRIGAGLHHAREIENASATHVGVCSRLHVERGASGGQSWVDLPPGRRAEVDELGE